MLLVLAALLAAGSADAGDAAQFAQTQNGPGRSFTAVRVVPADEASAPAPVADRAPVLSAEQPGAHSGWYSLYGGNHFGLLADGGVPGGAGLAGVFRPWQFLRLEGGGNWNYLSFGVRGGLTLIPFEWGVTPTLHVEGGHFFPADLSKLSGDCGTNPAGCAAKVVLAHIPANYLSASLGLEFGSQQRFVFFLRAGLTWFRGEAQDIAKAINDQNTGGTTTVKSAGSMSMLMQVPTLSAGFLLFLF